MRHPKEILLSCKRRDENFHDQLECFFNLFNSERQPWFVPLDSPKRVEFYKQFCDEFDVRIKTDFAKPKRDFDSVVPDPIPPSRERWRVQDQTILKLIWSLKPEFFELLGYKLEG